MKIGLIQSQPGAKNIELDFIRQISLLLTQWGHEAIVLDPLGNRLDVKTACLTEEKKEEVDNLNFILYFEPIPKLIDCFSYVINASPLRHLVFHPETGEPCPPERIDFMRSAMLSHDHLLSTSSPALDEFQYARFGDTRWTPLASDLTLHQGCRFFSELRPIEVNSLNVCHVIDTPAHSVEAARYIALIQRLDSTGGITFYELDSDKDIRIHKRIDNYGGRLPLDSGESIAKTANQHGITLLLPSTAHQESALPPRLLFHACAARSIIIAPNNPFFQDHFTDSLLTFEYGTDPESTASAIFEKISWIRSHPEEARKKAEQSHKVFRKHYSLDIELEKLLTNHQKQILHLENRYAKLTNRSVGLIFLCRKDDVEYLDNFFLQLQHSRHIPVKGIVLLAAKQLSEAQDKLAAFDQCSLLCEIIGIDDMEQQPAGALVHKALSEHTNSTFFAQWNPRIRWHRDHLANLALEIVNSNNLIAQSATYIKNTWFDQSRKATKTAEYSTTVSYRLDGLSLLRLDKSQLEFGSFLFHTGLLYQNWSFMSLLKHLDTMYPFLLILDHVKRYRRFPSYIPRYTTQHTMRRTPVTGKTPKQSHFHLSDNGRQESFTPQQQQSFLRGACSSSNDHDWGLTLLNNREILALIQKQLPAYKRNRFKRWFSITSRLKRFLQS